MLSAIHQREEKGGDAVKTQVIEKEAIRRNAAVIKEKAGSAAIYAVLTGDAGGGAVLRRHRSRLRLVEALSPRELLDVDTPADLSR